MEPDHYSISAGQFEDLAGNDPAGWQLLKGARVDHSVFGPGVIVGIDTSSEVLFAVRFDQPHDGKFERKFSALGFGKFFSPFSLPRDRLEQVRAYLAARAAQRKAVPAPRPKVEDHAPRPPVAPRQLLRQSPSSVEHRAAAKPHRRKPRVEASMSCPYCIFNDTRDEVAAHIRLDHPHLYREWQQANERQSQQSAGKGNKPQKPAAPQATYQEISHCPLCNCLISAHKYPRHLSKAHPGKTAEDYPLPPGIRKLSAKKRKYEAPTRNDYGPVSMKVLNVGRKNKHYTHH